MKTTILCTTTSFGASAPHVLTRMADLGLNVVRNPYKRKLTEEELADLIRTHTPAGLLAGTEPISGTVLELGLPWLKVVSRVGVGWDNVDHGAARKMEIKVFRTEGVLDHAVAELALAMILDLVRKVGAQDRAMRAGTWKKKTGTLLRGKTVGILGLGSIGRQVGHLCNAFGARVIFSDVQERSATFAEQVSLPELLRSAQIISVHASGDAALLGREELESCREGVILVNTARGGMIDETALADALDSGKAAGAGLDVFNHEPYEGPLTRYENVVLTPHVGSYAREARAEMEEMAVDNLLRGLDLG
jgi:D-3-phosphoglycerate dehydrogenase